MLRVGSEAAVRRSRLPRGSRRLSEARSSLQSDSQRPAQSPPCRGSTDTSCRYSPSARASPCPGMRREAARRRLLRHGSSRRDQYPPRPGRTGTGRLRVMRPGFSRLEPFPTVPDANDVCRLPLSPDSGSGSQSRFESLPRGLVVAARPTDQSNTFVVGEFHPTQSRADATQARRALWLRRGCRLRPLEVASHPRGHRRLSKGAENSTGRAPARPAFPVTFGG